MKKIAGLFILLCLFGCSKSEKITEEEHIESPIVEEVKYVDNNPIIVGLYENDYTLVTDYYTSKIGDKDLFFTTYYTNDKTLTSGSTKYKWYQYFNNYEDINRYRIGYNISFYVGDELISKNIISIENEYIFDPYFYVYLYDDIHQIDGVWYSHITKEQDSSDTMYTSIKLYLVEPEKITSPITLTAFTYDSDDFDELGNYRGNSKYEIKINWQ